VNAGKNIGVKIKQTTPQHISDMLSKAGASGVLPLSIPIVMPDENAVLIAGRHNGKNNL